MADTVWTTAERNVHKFMHIGDDKFINESTIASAATIVPVAYHTLITGTADITTITIPYTGFTGTLAFTWVDSGPGDFETSATNIAAHCNAVRYQTVFMTYSQQTSLWYPSYV